MTVQIRNAHQNELESLLNLYQHLQTTDAPLPEDSTLRQVWSDILSDLKVHCLVACLNGEIVVSCVLAAITNLTRSARLYGLIKNVVTHAAHQRKGIATQLLRHALQVAWGKNYYKVMRHTGSKREEIHHFYEQASFTKGGKNGFVAKP